MLSLDLVALNVKAESTVAYKKPGGGLSYFRAIKTPPSDAICNNWYCIKSIAEEGEWQKQATDTI